MDIKSVTTSNGKGGHPAHVVYKNTIYDVSTSKLWKNGTHMNRHSAGEDLSEFMSMAPHGPEVLERFTSVGSIEETQEQDDSSERYRTLYNKYHPHPVLLHYPMGVLPFGALLLLLHIVTGYQKFEPASYYALIFGEITLVPVIAAGILSWCINYQRMFTKIFMIKFIFSIIVIILCTSAVFLRPMFTEINTETISLLYCLSYFSSIPCLITIAYHGGKITWPT